MIRQNVSVGAHDYAGPERALQRLLRLLLAAIAEQSTKEGIITKWKLLWHADALVGSDRDDRGCNFGDQIRIGILWRRVRNRRKIQRWIRSLRLTTRD